MVDNMATAIEVRRLAKRFGEVRAVDGIDFVVRRGELFGFLGPNGAGKTTTINLLTGLARPDQGSIRIGGIDCTHNPKAAQHLMGVVPDESNLYPELTGMENLSFCGSLYGMAKRARKNRARELLERFGLREAADRKFAGYSKGMKRKLTIAAGIIHQPAILFLDEPTAGIDVASSRQIRELIAELNRAGTTIFLTTHYIEEAERLCGRIAFIVGGRIACIDTVEHLMQPAQGRHVMEFSLGGHCRENNGDRVAQGLPQPGNAADGGQPAARGLRPTGAHRAVGTLLRGAGPGGRARPARSGRRWRRSSSRSRGSRPPPSEREKEKAGDGA